MKHLTLHSVAHNFATSLAGGLSFVVPHHVLSTNVYAEAAATPDGTVEIDFLNGTTKGAYPGGEVECAAPLFKLAFPAFCAKHGVESADFCTFKVQFIAETGGNRFVISIADRQDKQSSREYLGTIGKGAKAVDSLGRLRPKHP